MLKKQKNIRFNGTGASHQNGTEERNIKTVLTVDITMLIHTAIIFPEGKFYTELYVAT